MPFLPKTEKKSKNKKKELHKVETKMFEDIVQTSIGHRTETQDMWAFQVSWRLAYANVFGIVYQNQSKTTLYRTKDLTYFFLR